MDTLFSKFEDRKQRLQACLKSTAGQVKVKKKTTSNLFRYSSRTNPKAKAISLKDFNHVLHIDEKTKTLDVEGLTTYEAIVDATLAHGLLPTVAPELKHITIGGATVGIGIESTGFKYGFVHDGLIEAEILLPSGKIVLCRPDNEYADLFHALPNSYGTLGYILRAKIQLYPAKKLVHLTNTRYNNIDDYLAELKKTAETKAYDFIEGLFYDSNELYLTTGRFVDAAPFVNSIYKENIYHKELRQSKEMFLPTKDYIFRFDPDWFWNIPETPLYNIFRRLAPKSLRNSGFYKRYTHYKGKALRWLPVKIKKSDEPLIQDWEVPWEHAKTLTEFALKHVDLQGRPWVALPIKPAHTPSLYPVRQNELYFNLGCYCYVAKEKLSEDFYYTKLLDNKCFALGGIKMLYSSTFLDEETFNQVYNGNAYKAIKQKYDPHQNAPTLYEKAVQAR